jgi:hypothetical protein
VLRNLNFRRVLLGVSLAYALNAGAQDAPLRLAHTRALDPPTLAADAPPGSTHRLQIDAVVMTGSGWDDDAILEAIRAAGRILAQCGVRLERAELYVFDGPDRYRYYETRASRELVRRVRPAKPALFFVRDTLQRPAFDAEAIGRANSASRPELANTVWVAAGARDLPVAIAHELVHVLADSGAHVAMSGNLMRDETAPDATALTQEQCEAIRSSGERSGLLQREPRE